MTYLLIKLEIPDPSKQELVLAFLSQLPIEMFEESASGLHLYLPTDAFTDDFEAEFKEICRRFELTYTQEFLEDRNWNAQWERSFQPVKVDNFCGIRASFHEPIQNTTHEIIVDPKMAFGTGHHETTYMMVAAMEGIPFSGKYVLDYGCGTGVLAILAHKLGAKPIVGIDIDPLSVESTHENSLLNKAPGILVRQGDLDVLKEKDFDCILANINRNVILNALPQLARLLKSGGGLVTTGFLIEDQDLVIDSAKKQNFTPIKTFERGEWMCIYFQKT